MKTGLKVIFIQCPECKNSMSLEFCLDCDSLVYYCPYCFEEIEINDKNFNK
jgi:hypothetical protein